MENLKLTCSCGKPVTRVWEIYHEEPDTSPFSAGYSDIVRDGYTGDCGCIHQDFDVYPRLTERQCQPVIVTDNQNFSVQNFPPDVEILPEIYKRYDKPQIKHPVLEALKKVKLSVRDGELVINLAGNGQAPPTIPISLPAEGNQIVVTNIESLA